jgi:pimeloyl-ACP methyl ester carboxylesterase
LPGCPGDYCGVALGNDISVKLEGGNVKEGVGSEFRRKLMEMEYNDYGGDAVSKSSKSSKRRTNSSRGGIDDSKHANNTSGADSSSSLNKVVSQKTIVQSRSEKHLVEILLKRIRNNKNDKQDYLKSLDDIDLALTFPGHVYNNVKVCENCYCVYNVIDEHRSRAIKKLGIVEDRIHGVAAVGAGHGARSQFLFDSVNVDKENVAANDVTAYANTADDTNNDNNVDNNNNLFIATEDSTRSSEVLGMLRAYSAIEDLTKSDISELRSYTHPPPAVIMVTSVLMILLKGSVTTWYDTKKIMSNGDRFMNMLLDFDPDSITVKQMNMLRPYEANPNFHPDAVSKVCECGGKFLSWCIGMLNAYRWKRGLQHSRIDPLKNQSFSNGVFSDNAFSPNSPNRKMPMIGFKGPDMVRTGGMRKSISFAEKLAKRREQREVELMSEKASIETQRPNTSPVKRSKNENINYELDSVWAEIELDKRGRQDRAKRMVNKNRSIQPLEVGFGRTNTSTNVVNVSPMKNSMTNFQQAMLSSKPHPFTQTRDNMMPLTGPGLEFDQSLTGFYNSAHNTTHNSTHGNTRALTKREKQLKAVAQKTQMERLASRPSENIEMEPNGTRKIMCEDEATRLCYSVSGTLSMEAKTANFVVCHDIFDHHIATNMNFKKMVVKHPGSQFLCWNYPGQADTTWPNLSESEKNHGGEEQKLTAEFIADRLHELLQHVEVCGEMLLSSPFHIVGFGFGSMVAATFAAKYGKYEQYKRSLRSVVSINGYTSVDAQLAAIMHSSVNVFKAFPASRPDLPISYFTQFLFSEDYLSKVDKNLAMNIYTAIPNPITLAGRIRLCKGVLASTNMSQKIKGLHIPTIVMQSTDNILVNASNVDPFLTSRAANHLWSHEIKMSNPPEKSCLGQRGIQLLEETMGRPYGAFVAWVKGGHEIKQENKRFVLDVMDCMCKVIWGVEDEGAVGTLDSVANMRLGNYEGATGATHGTLVPSDEFMDTVKGIEERRKEEEKKAEEEPEMSVLDILDNGKMSAAQMQETIVREKREAEEKEARDAIEQQDEAIRSKLAAETDALFGAEMETAKSAGDKLLLMQAEIETELADAMRETVEASSGTNMLSGDELLANLQINLDGTQLMSSVDKIAGEAEEKNKKMVAEEMSATKKRVQAGSFVPAQPELVINLGQQQETPQAPAAAAAPASSATPVVAGGAPTMPPRIDETDETVSEQVMLKQKEIDAEIDERYYAQEEFEKVMGSHQRSVVKDLKDKASLVPVPPIEQLLESHLREEQERKDSLAMFDAAPVAGQGSFNVGTGQVETYEVKRADTSLPPGLFANPVDRLERDGENSDAMKENRSWVLGEDGDREGKKKKPPVLRSADEVLREESVIEDGISFAKAQLEKKRREADDAAARMIMEIQKDQEMRRKQYEEEDRALLKTVETQKDLARRARVNEDMQRRLEVERVEMKLVGAGVIDSFNPDASTAQVASDGITNNEDTRVRNPVMTMPPTFLEEQPDLPAGLRVTVQKTEDVLSELEKEQKEAESMGIMRLEDFQDIKRKQAQAALDREMKLRTLESSEQQALFEEMAHKIQTCYRGRLGRLKSQAALDATKNAVTRASAALKIQKCMRGKLARNKMRMIREMEISQLVLGGSAILLQKTYRGYVGRTIARKKKIGVKTIVSPCCIESISGNSNSKLVLALILI